MLSSPDNDAVLNEWRLVQFTSEPLATVKSSDVFRLSLLHDRIAESDGTSTFAFKTAQVTGT